MFYLRFSPLCSHPFLFSVEWQDGLEDKQPVHDAVWICYFLHSFWVGVFLNECWQSTSRKVTVKCGIALAVSCRLHWPNDECIMKGRWDFALEQERFTLPFYVAVNLSYRFVCYFLVVVVVCCLARWNCPALVPLVHRPPLSSLLSILRSVLWPTAPWITVLRLMRPLLNLTLTDGWPAVDSSMVPTWFYRAM